MNLLLIRNENAVKSLFILVMLLLRFVLTTWSSSEPVDLMVKEMVDDCR